MLEVEALACQRGSRRLFQGLCFKLNPGELLHIQGSNGSGKTSLLRILAGLSHQDAGVVRWDGIDIRESNDEFVWHLLYLGHSPAVKDDLTVRENLLVTTRLSGLNPDPQHLDAALDATGMLTRSALPARVLSQGQRRRLALARLWIDKRPLWVLDEPFTALDVHATRLLEERMEKHLAEGGMIVLTTHQRPNIAEHFLRILSVS